MEGRLDKLALLRHKSRQISNKLREVILNELIEVDIYHRIY